MESPQQGELILDLLSTHNHVIGKINATDRKENSHSLATNAVRRAQQAHNYNTGVRRESKARLCGHNPVAGKTPKWEAKDDSTWTGCPLGLTKTHQAAR